MSASTIVIARRVAGGTDAHLARLLGITQSAIHQWDGVIPPKRAIEIEEKTSGAVTRWELRPDFFGEQPRRKRTA